jgi:predicted transcriptional regulator YdeE
MKKSEVPAPEVREVPTLTVIGYSVRTSNAREMSGKDGRIGPLWGKYMQGGSASIAGVTEPGTDYAVYTNYESDEKGEYDLILGKSAKRDQQPPTGTTRIEIPAARYLVFTASGNSPDAIRAAWLAVYGFFKRHPERSRAFTHDFEQYSGGAPKLFIAIR